MPLLSAGQSVLKGRGGEEQVHFGWTTQCQRQDYLKSQIICSEETSGDRTEKFAVRLFYTDSFVQDSPGRHFTREPA